MSVEHKTPKKKDSPPKKKFLKFQKMRNPLIAGSLIAVIAVAGILGGLILLREQDSIEEKDTLIIGLYMGPQSFDPFILPWPVGMESYYLFDQVAEGLFEYDYRNKTNPINNNLAKTAEWSNDNINFTCTLRGGIKFHDGTPFNAYAVKWNIDRLYRLFENASWWIPMMWRLPDSLIPIVNETIVIDEYTVRFVLNDPYAPFKALLMHCSSYILSPTSTPHDRPINIHNETMVGTGPFLMDSFEIIDSYGWLGVTSNTTLLANKEYWNGRPEIDEVLLKAYFFNDTKRYEEMLSGDLSFTYSKDFGGDVDLNILEICETNPEIDVDVLELTTSIHSYIQMNYERVNVTMRKAISYAYNYTHDFEKIYNRYAERLKSYIPQHFRHSNWTAFDVSDYNITKARQVLKDANWPGTETLTADGDISPGNDWEMIAISPTPLATYNTSNGYDNWKLNATAALLYENLKQIGVKLEVFNMSNDEYYEYAEEGRLDFCKSRFVPDYDDPDNVITPLFSNTSYLTNWQKYNDPWVQQKIKEGITETDPIARKHIYYDIQKYLIEESYPHLLLYNEVQYDYWNSNVGEILSAYRSDFTFKFKNLHII